MAAALGKRLLSSVLLLAASTVVVFSLIHLAPGDPVNIILGGRKVDAATVQAIRARYLLDKPIVVQYVHWVVGVLHGDLGQSFEYRASVASVLGPRVLPTLELALYASLLVLTFGLLLGIVTAVRRGSVVDGAGSFLMLLASSISPYVSGILLILVFAVGVGWFPVFGLGTGGVDSVVHLTLPAIALAVALVALLGRVTRSSLSQALDEEFVETARSRGFTERRVVLKYAMRSALVPVVTVGGVIVGYLISGAVLVEYTFGLNGVGALLVDSVLSKDFAVVQAIVLLFTSVFLIVNFVVDVLYLVIDPRTRLAQQSR